MKKTGLVLSGGGTKGAFEIGVWKALIEKDIAIDCVIGTSVGAINAAVIAQNDFDLAYHFWNNLTINQVLKLNSDMADKYVNQWSGDSFDLFRLGFINDLFSGGLDISPLRENLARLIDEDKVRRSPVRLGLVTVELDTLKPVQLMIEDIPQGRLLDYLLASAALPVFQRQEIDGKTYLDGGFYDNLPINFMADSGYTNIIAVDFPAPGFKKKIKEDHLNIKVVNNSEYLGMIMEFSQAVIQNNIQMGYLDCLKTFGYLHGKNYYFDIMGPHGFYDKLTDFIGTPLADAQAQQEIDLLLDLPPEADRDTVLLAIFSLLERTNYGREPSKMISLLEMTGKSLNVPRLQAYSLDHFILALLTALEKLTEDNLSFLKQADTIQKAFIENTDGYKPTTILDFISFYVLFVGAKNDLPFTMLHTLIKKFTPEFTLSMMMLIEIHQLLNQ